MTDELERQRKRNRKVARSLIRLKHSLEADDEIEAYLEVERDALTSGGVMRPVSELTELLGEE